ncbi:MAG: flagellar assembly protein A [Desulfobacteraceae bacterium]
MTDSKVHKVLVVDDEEPVLKMLRRVLKRSGFPGVISALNGEQALKLLKQHKNQFFLIISDLHMPGMSGTELLEKSILVSPESRRMLITGFSDLDGIADAVNQGGIHQYIAKPWDNRELVEKVSAEFAVYQKFQERKRLFKLTKHQASKLFGYAGEMKKREKAFKENIRRKKETEKWLEQELLSARKEAENRKTFPGLDELLSRTIPIKQENLIHCFSLAKSELFATMKTLGEKHQITVSEPDRVFDANHIEEETFETIDQIIELVMQKVEPKMGSLDSGPSKTGDVDDYETLPDFAFLALTDGYITEKELERAEERFAAGQETAGLTMEKVLLEMGLLLRKEASVIHTKRALIETRLWDRKMAEELVTRKAVSVQETQRAFLKQWNDFEESGTVTPLADIFLESGIITRETRDQVYEAIDRTDKKAPAEVEQPSGVSLDYGAFVDLDISRDRLKAYIRIPKSVQGAEDIGPVKALLKKQGIKYGVVDDFVLKRFIRQESNPDERFVVARGDAPDHGEQPRIVFHFSREKERAGVVAADGSIDFRETGRYGYVNEGELLAELIPGKRARPGRDVFGEPIPVGDRESVSLKCGTGAELSKDGLKILAKISGQPSIDPTGVVSVLEELYVKGDVNFETGNIDFNGNVVVHGFVTQGFTIACENLVANGIDGGTARVTGDLNISTGIVNASVETRGNIQAKYINHSTVYGGGDVMVTREIMGSHISVSGAIDNKGGRITSSVLAARKGFTVRQIGTEKAERSTIKMGVDDHAQWLAEQFDTMAGEVEKQLDTIYRERAVHDEEDRKLHGRVASETFAQEKTAGEIAAMREKMGRGPGADAAASTAVNKIKELETVLKKIDEKIEAFFENQDAVQKKIQACDEKAGHFSRQLEGLKKEKEAFLEFLLLDDPVAVLTVNKKIVAGTKIVGTASTLIVKRDTKMSKFMEIDAADSDSRETKQIVHQTL